MINRNLIFFSAVTIAIVLAFVELYSIIIIQDQINMLEKELVQIKTQKLSNEILR